MHIHNSSALLRLPSAVLLDIDNTVYAYDPAHHAAYEAIQKKMVQIFSVKAADVDHAFLKAKSEIKQTLGNSAASHSRLLYLQRMFELMGLGSQPLLVLDFEQTYWRTFLTHAHLFDDVKEFLDDLRLLRIPSAAVTDLTAQIQFRKLIYFGLDRYFSAVITSEEVGFDKPHAGIFQLAVQKIQPRENNIWMIGDSTTKDIQGAKEAIGATTLQKIHHGISPGADNALPDAYFYHFSELRNLLKKLGN